MKIAYLILAHNNHHHLSRLLHSLNDINVRFYIHIDLKTNIDKFLPLMNLPNVIFLKNRIPVYWGGYSIIQATLNLIRKAISTYETYDYFILLSGEDYPLKSNQYIYNFLNRNNYEYISIAEMPIIREYENKPLEWLERYHQEKIFPYYLSNFERSNSLLRRAVNYSISIFVKRNYKKYLRGLTPFAGSEWWTLTNEAIEYVLAFLDNNPDFVRFFKHTILPDEVFFHTIIGNSYLKEKTTTSLTYVDWKELLHPEYLSEHHVQLFKDLKKVIIDDEVYGKGECLFARKFSENSESLLDQIDLFRSQF